MKIIDTRGHKCPMPLIMTKKALQELSEGEALKILIGSDNSKKNVSRFLSDNNVDFVDNKKGNNYEFIINHSDDITIETEAETYCKTEISTNNFILVFGKKTIGEGSEELGEMLVQGFLNTFLETDNLPQKIIFLNSGIELSVNETDVLSILKKMEEKGVEMLSCGTCLEYYNKSDNLKIGRVSNAYDILMSITNSPKVINF